MQLTHEHEQIADTVRRFVAREINPHVAEWEAAQQFPLRDVLKKLGNLGLLGLKYPVEYGGMALDFSYSMVMAEALGDCNCGGVLVPHFERHSTSAIASQIAPRLLSFIAARQMRPLLTIYKLFFSRSA